MTDLGHDITHGTRHPDWIVQSVCDPDGQGKDFAYTIGLFDRQLPELHMWARPSLGDDPGADWILSPSDRCHVLNEVAWRLIDNDASIGSEWEESYDDGLATVRFRIDPPGDRGELGAFGIAEGALVLPVRWSLHRASLSKAVPLTRRARVQAHLELETMLSTVRTPGALPSGWRLPTGRPRFAFSERYGPLTALVTARAAQLLEMNGTTLRDLVVYTMVAERERAGAHPTSVAMSLARASGRGANLARANTDSQRLVDQLLGRPEWRLGWQEVHAWIGGGEADAKSRHAIDQLENALRVAVQNTFLAEVVADQLTHKQLLSYRGPWLWAMKSRGELPGPEWRAPLRIVREVTGLLASLDGPALHGLVEAHRGVEGGLRQDGYGDLSARLLGLAVTESAGCPWLGHLDDLPVIQDVAAKQLRNAGILDHSAIEVRVAPIPEVAAVATALTAALVAAAWLTDVEVAVLVQRLGRFVPGLESALLRERARA